MFSWLVGQYLRFNIRRLLAGDVDGLLRQFHPNAELIFPGRTSFSGTFRGREAVGAWLRRFVSLRPEYIVHDVLVAGPPWNMRVAYRMTDRIGSHYSNEAMVYLRFRWFRAVHERVFLDTELVSEWERDHPEETGRELVGTGSRSGTRVG
jgi:ketosteroid isomerase-like protein